MISPLEIQEKEFSRGLKGFKEDEVNEFLDQITLDLERLLEENRQLRAERDQMEEELKKYKNSESAALRALYCRPWRPLKRSWENFLPARKSGRRFCSRTRNWKPSICKRTRKLKSRA